MRRGRRWPTPPAASGRRRRRRDHGAARRPRSSGPCSTGSPAFMIAARGPRRVRHGRGRRRRSSRRQRAIEAPLRAPPRKGGNPLDRLLRQLLGLDAKMRQYAEGARVRPRRRRPGRRGRLQRGLDLAGDAAHQGRDRRTRTPGSPGCTADRRPPERWADAPRPVAAVRPRGPPRALARRCRRAEPVVVAVLRWRRLARAGRRDRLRRARRPGGVPARHRRPRPAAGFGASAPRPSSPTLRRALGVRPGRRRARSTSAGAGGPEAAARDARYAALDAAAARLGAAPSCSATPSTTRPRRCCSGWAAAPGRARSPGMPARRGPLPRPLLGLRRARRPRAACAALGLDAVGRPAQRRPALPPGPGAARGCCRCSRTCWAAGVAEALARTAELLRDDADALDALARGRAGRGTRRRRRRAGRRGARSSAAAALRTRVLAPGCRGAGCRPR